MQARYVSVAALGCWLTVSVIVGDDKATSADGGADAAAPSFLMPLFSLFLFL